MYNPQVTIVEITGWISQLPPHEQIGAWRRINRLTDALAGSSLTGIPISYWAAYTAGAIMALNIHYPVKEW